MPRLPQELIEVIINQVDDRKTLKACSLVASSFVCPSQRLLFLTVDLDNAILTPRKKAYSRLLRLLTLNPLLGTYVRSLRLGDDSEDYGFSRSWIIHAKNLPQLFQLLPRLEIFSLTFNSDERNWKSIPANIRSAFERLFCLPTVQAISLEFIRGFPHQLLFELMRLKRLSLSFVEVDDVNDIQCHLAVSELRELHLRGTPPPTITAITRCLPQSSPSLHRLAITPTLEPGFCAAISELMIAVGSNITHFEWLPSVHFSPSSAPLDITRLPHLRFLRFSITSRKFRSSRNHFTEMLHLLDQISTNADNRIETIELECKFMRCFDDKKIQMLKTQWRPLEKVLDKVGFRNSLKEVRVKLSIITDGTSNGYNTAIVLMDLFPSLKERGVTILISTFWNESSSHCY